MAWTRSWVNGSLLDQANADQDAIDLHMHTVSIDGGDPLGVFDSGQGEPILLLPMTSELNFVYAAQIEEFQSSHRMILYKPRLSARSHVGIADRAQEAVSLMTRLGLDSTHIIVWGDTGSAAYYLAKQWPEKCRSIVFIGLADRYRFPQPFQFLMGLLAHLPIEGLVPARVFAFILGTFVGGTQIKPRWFVERASQVPDLTRRFKHSILPNLTEHRPIAGEVRVPCLVVCGDNDRIVSVSQAQRMARLLPNGSQAVIMVNGQHFVSYVDGAAVNRVIREFYASLA